MHIHCIHVYTDAGGYEIEKGVTSSYTAGTCMHIRACLNNIPSVTR